jgi:hypothetical protein
MGAPIRPSSSIIVQESAEQCEVGHTWEKVHLEPPGQLMFMLITAQRLPHRSRSSAAVGCRRPQGCSADRPRRSLAASWVPELVTVPPAKRTRVVGAASDHHPRHAGAGGARRRAISDGISLDMGCDSATPAIWNITYRPWLTTLRQSSSAFPAGWSVTKAPPPWAAPASS